MSISRTYSIFRRRSRRLLGALGRLRPADVPTLLQIVRLVSRYQRLEGRTSLPDLVASFDRGHAAPADATSDFRRLTYLIDLVMKTVYRDRYCMKRSLIHFYYMRRAGLPVAIAFGVTRENQEMTGHAWVEVDGYPYAERRDPRRWFVRTYQYPPPEVAAEPDVASS